MAILGKPMEVNSLISSRSAALYGIRSKNNVTAVVLYPEGRVSDIQERQMTTLTDDNIHNIAVKGTFDDCQCKLQTPTSLLRG